MFLKTELLDGPFWRKRVRSGHATLEKKGFLSPVVFRARITYYVPWVRSILSHTLGWRRKESFFTLASLHMAYEWVGRVGINSFQNFTVLPQKRCLYNTALDDKELCIIKSS